MEWYQRNEDELISELSTDVENGLASTEVESRLAKYGHNELKEEEKKGLMSKIIAQFSDFLILILIAAALISIFVGEVKDAVVILAIVVVNAALGIYQEGKAEKSLEALKKMASPNAKVVRNGKSEIVPSSSLVPGDIVVIETGDIIPADLRLIESSNLKIEEASLTGESVPVEKNSKLVLDSEVSLGDRANMAYMSTIVNYGRGKAVVVGTGHDTEIGKIATLIQTFEDELTPLQKKLNQLGKLLGTVTIAVVVLVFVIGMLQGRGALEMFMTAISLAVAAIPEGLAAIVTIVLSLGMNKMVERHAIVKKLLAVETLGSTSVICSDKTGTLTQNEMTVTKVYTDDAILDITGGGYEPVGDFVLNGENISVDKIKNLNTLLSAAILANDAQIEQTSDGYRVLGDPTEGALVTLAGKAGITRKEINDKFPRIEELPFDSDRKMMTTFHSNFIPGKIVSFTKGAPDIIISRCTHVLMNNEVVTFTDDMKKKALTANSNLAKDALRVLAYSFKEYDKLPEKITSDINENNLIFIGLSGMIDPPRPEVKEAIKLCKQAGINTVMITGDYKETAFAIAKDLGMAEREDQAMMGAELNKLSDAELREVVKDTKVYARVSPEHKVRIVTALKENGDITAMTGDGVNDALALKKADIGISMGITGTDVAKNTAEMILTDDNFASIVAAVEEGRIIFANIKKFVFFLLSCNIGEVILVFASIILGWEVPLLPIQLLWLNLVTDSFPALALGVEKGEPDIMDQKPRDPNEPIIDRGMMISIIFQSIAVAGGSLLAYYWGMQRYPDSIEHARTITFATLITAELLRAYSSRSQKFTLLKIGIFSNMAMVLATTFAFILLLVVLYVPFLQEIFYTFPLGLLDWEIVLSFAFIPLLVGEIVKAVKNKK